MATEKGGSAGNGIRARSDNRAAKSHRLFVQRPPPAALAIRLPNSLVNLTQRAQSFDHQKNGRAFVGPARLFTTLLDQAKLSPTTSSSVTPASLTMPSPAVTVLLVSPSLKMYRSPP